MQSGFTGREWAAGLVFGLLMLAALLEGEPGGLIILAAIALLYWNRRQEQTRVSRAGAEDRQERPANVEQVHSHALQAVRRAGLDPDTTQVLVVDIGLLSFRGDADPAIHRTVPVDDDSDYIQPFMQLRVPMSVNGRIKFEIVDNDGATVYIHEDFYQLQRGRNLVIPATRLPLHDERRMDGRWRVQVSADGTRIANYIFDWARTEDSSFRRHLSEDGEISSEMRALLAENRLQRLSLDELLAAQDDQAGQSARGGASQPR